MKPVAFCLLSLFFLRSGVSHADSPPLPEGFSPGQVFKDCDYCPEMVVIPAGSFAIGKPVSKPGRASDEKTQYPLGIHSFAIGKTEVTQGLWKAVMGSNPSKFAKCGDDCPVEQVSWNDVQEFIRRLNAKTGKTYRLPSDVEWEYACRAGSTNRYCGGGKLGRVAWYEGNSQRTTHPVANKQPNAWGLYDMTGNVWEWTRDCYKADRKAEPPAASVPSVDGCKQRTLRGGSWGSFQRLAHSVYRSGYPAKNRAYDVVSRRSDFGLRLAATLP